MKLFTRKSKNKLPNKQTFNLTIKHAWLLILCQSLNVGLIAIQINTWMLAVISLTLFWQASLIWRDHKAIANSNDVFKLKVPPLLLASFAICGCLAIYVTAKSAGILISMVHLLSFSYVIKAFELKKRSDFYQLILLGFFVLASALIFRQDLWFTVIVIAVLMVNFAVLMQLFSLQQASKNHFKVSSLILAQSMILAIVLFLVFPRLEPFWQVPLEKSAGTGLSEEVKPGDIAELAKSTKLAFRADFSQQAIPQYAQLYWRAMVLENYDGAKWSKRDGSPHKLKLSSKRTNQITNDAAKLNIAPISYKVINEASFQRYLFTLAPAVPVDESINRTLVSAKYTIESKKLLTQTTAYQFNSFLNLPMGLELTDVDKQLNLSYPQASNPKLQALGKQLILKYKKPAQRAQAILELIRKEQYFYTLKPGLLSNNSLDEFFFNTKSGFCEHYASAFTFLMRASGVPARMVTGYMGGELNKINADDDKAKQQYLSVFQYDAHAWAEIWIQGKGWQRVDPTGAVDPQRVNSGWSEQLYQEQSNLTNNVFSLHSWKNNAFLNTLRLQLDMLDFQWTRWVVGFSNKEQYDLFQQWFGEMKSWKLALIIAAALILSMLLLIAVLSWYNRIPNPKRSLQNKLYQKALMLLAKQGLDKPASMTVNDFALYVRNQSPELGMAFTRFSASYNALSYQTLSSEELQQLELKINNQFQQVKKLIK